MSISETNTIDEFELWRKTGQLAGTSNSDDDIVSFMNRQTRDLRFGTTTSGQTQPNTSAIVTANVTANVIENDQVRIILNTMMKNEDAIMERCIKSALPIIDAVCYSDTGSDAKTFEILRKVVPLHIPLCVEVEPWRNFGYNRTVGLQQTERFARRMGWNLAKTYALCIDADMELKVDPQFSKESLQVDCYTIDQFNGRFIYHNSRLLRLSNQWFAVGRTHEYYNVKIPLNTVPEKLSTLHINDISDGANRVDKFDRDIIFLMEDLIEDPKNSRAMFYLAESYRNRGRAGSDDYSKAIQYYQKHIETGSWAEEMWFSMFMIGMCYEHLKDEPKMLQAYLHAYQNRPHRAEPLYRIGRYYRSRSEDANALVFFKMAEQIPFPFQDVLFVDKNNYDFNILFEMSVSCHSTNNIQLGNYCIQKLLRRRDGEITPYFRDLANFNARFFIQPLGASQIAELSPRLEAPYRPCNPSIVRGNGESSSLLKIICRAVNYSQRCARNHKVIDDTGIFNSRNVVMTVHAVDFQKLETFQLISENKVQSQSVGVGPFYHSCWYRGLEDARLLLVDNGKTLAFSCTSLEFTTNNQPRIVWVELEETQDGTYFTKKMSLITGYNDDQTQKNWLPFVWDGGDDDDKKQSIDKAIGITDEDIYFIYSYNPLTILKFDREASTVKVHKQVNLPIHSAEWRGSSGPVRVPGNKWLLLVHEVCDRPEHRFYMHRFVLMDHNFTQLQSTSDLFYFQHATGVEMATGLVFVDNVLLITVGIEDSKAIMVKVNWRDVEKMMQPVVH